VDNSSRNLHGALLDSEILADVYLAMTGGQSDLGLSFGTAPDHDAGRDAFDMTERPPLQILLPTDEEKALHEARLQAIKKKSGRCLWLEM
jgi:DNA polymerase-3 subunit epsilon